MESHSDSGRSCLTLVPLRFDPLRLPPDDPAPVEVAKHHLAHPARCPALAQARGGDAVRGQPLGDAREPAALRDLLEDAPDGGRFRWDDFALDMVADHLPVGADRRDLPVPVSVDQAAGHVPPTRLPLHRVAGPHLRPLAFHLAGEGRQREHDLVHRAVEGPLAILEVEPHSHASPGDLLQGVGRLDLLAAEASVTTAPAIWWSRHLTCRPR